MDENPYQSPLTRKEAAATPHTSGVVSFAMLLLVTVIGVPNLVLGITLVIKGVWNLSVHLPIGLFVLALSGYVLHRFWARG